MGIIDSVGKFFSGPDGPPEQMSQAERLANIFRLEDDKYREKNYFPLEVHQIERAFDPSTSAIRRGILSARRSADIAKQEQEAIASARRRAQVAGSEIGSASNVAAFDSANRAVEGGLRTAGAQTDEDIQNLRDQDISNVIKTGRGLQTSIYGGLNGLANAQQNRAAGDIAAKRVRQDAENALLGDALAMGIYGVGKGYADSNNMDLADDQISPFARFLRKPSAMKEGSIMADNAPAYGEVLA